VVGPTLIVVSANGIPVPLQLAGVTLTPLEGGESHGKFVRDATTCIENALMRAGAKVRIALSRGYNYREGGTPLVYAYAGRGSTEKLLNELPIAKGLAYHDTATTERDTREKARLTSAESQAKKQRIGIWASGISPAPAKNAKPKAAVPEAPAAPPPSPPASPPPAPAPRQIAIRPDRFYAEEGSSTYYPGSNAWVKKMNPKKLREFESEAAAKAAGLRPFFSRSLVMGGTAKTGTPGKGKLVGLKTDNHFHGPFCVLLKNKPASSKIFFDTYEDAKKSGRTPCRSCLRLGNPGWQQPKEGECIGRAPPYFRHCFAKTDSKTRLCPRCSGLNR
jgi:endonuclease YncB( thermonuclease family)